jgi:hypothetical protein
MTLSALLVAAPLISIAAAQAKYSMQPRVEVPIRSEGPVAAAPLIATMPDRLIYHTVLCPSGNTVAQRVDRWRYTRIKNEPYQLRIVKSKWVRTCLP